MQKLVEGSDLGKKLIAAGIVPAEATRVIIDINPGDVVRVHIQVLGGPELLDVFDQVVDELAERPGAPIGGWRE